jgi:hypothetical protein
MQVQEKLNDFYLQAIRDLKNSGCFEDAQQRQLSAPFLLNVSEAYFQAPLRILFVGQETAGWVGQLNEALQRDDPVPSSLAAYARVMSKPKWQGSFLKKYRLVERTLGRGVRGSVVWSNLLKMDVDRGPGKSRNARGYSPHLDAFSEKLFRHEVELLRPDVMIFACGPFYDRLIKRYFESYVTTKVFERRALWKFNVGRVQCYRTWHPSTIRHGGERSIDWYFKEIIKDVRQSFPSTYGLNQDRANGDIDLAEGDANALPPGPGR